MVVRARHRPTEEAAVLATQPAEAGLAPLPAGAAPTPPLVGAAQASLPAVAGFSARRQAEGLPPAAPTDGAHHGMWACVTVGKDQSPMQRVPG